MTNRNNESSSRLTRWLGILTAVLLSISGLFVMSENLICKSWPIFCVSENNCTIERSNFKTLPGIACPEGLNCSRNNKKVNSKRRWTALRATIRPDKICRYSLKLETSENQLRDHDRSPSVLVRYRWMGATGIRELEWHKQEVFIATSMEVAYFGTVEANVSGGTIDRFPGPNLFEAIASYLQLVTRDTVAE